MQPNNVQPTIRHSSGILVLATGILLVLSGLLAFTLQVNAFAAALPPRGNIVDPGLNANFHKTLVLGNIASPTTIRMLPNDDMYIGQQSGIIRLLHNAGNNRSSLQSAPVISLAAQSDHQRGLMGLELDPNFTRNGWMYVSYTHTDGFSRLSRITVVNGVANPASEVVLVKLNRSSNTDHNADDVRWGPDGKLWWTVGDALTPSNASSLTSPHGKVLRVNPNGSIPADNPFSGQAFPTNTVYASGFRQPFRLLFLPTHTALVGDQGTTKFEEFDALQAGGNFGWPTCEGNCNTSGMTNPLYQYAHPSSSNFQAAMSAMVLYTGGRFPQQWRCQVFYADKVSGAIRFLQFNGAYTSVQSDTVFDSQAGGVTDIQVGPDGDLYYPVPNANAIYQISPNNIPPATPLPNPCSLTGKTPTPTSTSTPLPNTPTPTPTSVGTAVTLSNLRVSDSANAGRWSLQTNLQSGSVQYGDRGYTLVTLPAALSGASWVRTANASKAYTGMTAVTFTINQQAVVYVLFDTRLPLPSWVDGTWTNTGLTLMNSEAVGSNTFIAYSKPFVAGSVSLGSIGNTSVNMYTVAVR